MAIIEKNKKLENNYKTMTRKDIIKLYNNNLNELCIARDYCYEKSKEYMDLMYWELYTKLENIIDDFA